MLKSKIGKKLAAGATAVAMMASASAASISSLTAFAGELLGEGTFETGAGLPWHICENATGQMAFSITDGVYAIQIKSPGGTGYGGEDRWDCQFRHRGLSLEYNHTYRLTYSVYATNSGYMYAKIGNIENDDCEFWHLNGQPLSMTYTPGASQAEVESALRSASQTGSITEYWNGWDAWKNDQIPAKTWTTKAFEFKLNKSDINNTTAPDKIEGIAEWTFHFGGTGKYTQSECFPKGTILKFDNLVLLDMDSDKWDYVKPPEEEPTGLVLNQVGFYPNLDKIATLVVDEGDTKAREFTVKDSSGKVVYTGTSGNYIYDEGSWTGTQQLDFSDLKTVGEGYTVECDGKVSTPFAIGNDVLGPMLRDAMNYYYLNRSGIEIEEAYVANPGDNASKAPLTRKAGHKPDTVYISDEWVFIYTEEPTYSKSIDVTGGWYDAGDYGKYVVNGGLSMWTLANIYERDAVKDNLDKWKDGSEIMNIPETGNGTPDILDELMWEADFFLKMQRDDGMVYHKAHDYKWTALGVTPYPADGATEKELASQFPKRIVKPATYAATLNAAAAWAQLSRLLAPYNSAKADEYLAAAKKAYAAAKSAYEAKYKDIYANITGDPTKDDMFAPLDQNKGGGPYGDTNVADEFYWASSELYITTKDDAYGADMRAYPQAFEVPTELFGGENKGSCTSFTWGTLASLGTISLYLNQSVLTADEVQKVEEQIQKAGDYYLKVESESGFGTAYRGMTYEATVTDIIGDEATDKTIELTNGYEWGSNSMVVNNAMVIGLAYDITGDIEYLNGVISAWDYILGRNAMENSYVTGYGTNTTENPHHRYWCYELKNSWAKCPDGCLSGGPNSNMNDPMIQGAGYKIGELAPMKCYYDQVEAWSVNEITINWNAPLVWLSSYIEDEGPKAGDQPDGDIKWGDVNVDGEVDVADVIDLCKASMGAFTMTAQGAKNADVDQNGNADTTDASYILQSLIGLVTLPVKK